MKSYIPHTVRLQIAGARVVSVIGDFNHWHSSAHPLVQVGPDQWERIIDLPAGKHRYAFFVIEDPKVTGGGVKSRIVANGSVLWVPEDPALSVSISAHPGLALRRVA